MIKVKKWPNKLNRCELAKSIARETKINIYAHRVSVILSGKESITHRGLSIYFTMCPKKIRTYTCALLMLAKVGIECTYFDHKDLELIAKFYNALFNMDYDIMRNSVAILIDKGSVIRIPDTFGDEWEKYLTELEESYKFESLVEDNDDLYSYDCEVSKDGLYKIWKRKK